MKKTIQRKKATPLAALLTVLAGIVLIQPAQANLTINSSVVSLYASAYSNGGNLDQRTGGGPASGIENWTISAFSSNGGYTGSSSGSYQSDVGASSFNFSTSSQSAQISSTLAGNNGTVSSALTVQFSVDIESTAHLSLFAAFSTPAGGSFGNLILRQNGSDVVNLFRGSGSSTVSQDFTLTPGNAYEFIAVYQSEISSNSGLGLSTSITSGSGGMDIQAVPEPSTYLLLGLGAAALLLRRRKSVVSAAGR